MQYFSKGTYTEANNLLHPGIFGTYTQNIQHIQIFLNWFALQYLKNSNSDMLWIVGKAFHMLPAVMIVESRVNARQHKI